MIVLVNKMTDPLKVPRVGADDVGVYDYKNRPMKYTVFLGLSFKNGTFLVEKGCDSRPRGHPSNFDTEHCTNSQHLPFISGIE